MSTQTLCSGLRDDAINNTVRRLKIRPLVEAVKFEAAMEYGFYLT